MLDRDQLRAYYASHFPIHQIGLWLGFGRLPVKGGPTATSFVRREFSFSWDGIFCRHKCFQNSSDLQTYLKQRLPERIELGPVYSERPDQPLLTPRPVEREFIIDIDLTDMSHAIFTSRDNPRDASFQSSWTFIAAAVEILDMSLRKDFGFQHLLWVFSGRRGVHCWVADERARVLSFEARCAITDNLQFHHRDVASPANGLDLHPSLQRAADHLDSSGLFLDMLDEQEWLLPHRREWVLDFIEDEKMRDEVRERLSEAAPASQANQRILWGVLCNTLKNPRWPENKRRVNSRRWRNKPLALNTVSALMLAMAYPWLDANVSKSVNHLLKLPFAVHPLTGFICVPLDPTTVRAVDVTELPTLEMVCRDAHLLDTYVKTFKNCFVGQLHLSIVRRAETVF